MGRYEVIDENIDFDDFDSLTNKIEIVVLDFVQYIQSIVVIS